MTLPTSKYEYVKNFEKDEKCLPNSWLVVRVDGKSFSKFTEMHYFEKPNDKRGLELMNRAAASVMEELRDICLAFGQSDEYSFIFRKDTSTLGRRSDKLMTVVNSLFTSAYVFYWNDFFKHTKLLYPPGFDSRIVIYPSEGNLRDYLAWRQADTHVNNLYNTAFWALVLKGGKTKQMAQEILKGTLASNKHEILFKDFGINYNDEPNLYKKGTTMVRKLIASPADGKLRHFILPLTCDIIGDDFWKDNGEILGLKSLQVYHKPIEGHGYIVNKANNTELSVEHNDGHT